MPQRAYKPRSHLRMLTPPIKFRIAGLRGNSNYGIFVGARHLGLSVRVQTKSLPRCLAPTLFGKFRIADQNVTLVYG
jgi:hypothetical protein